MTELLRAASSAFIDLSEGQPCSFSDLMCIAVLHVDLDNVVVLLYRLSEHIDVNECHEEQSQDQHHSSNGNDRGKVHAFITPHLGKCLF